MSAEDDLINLGVCIKQQAERVGVEHEGVPLEGVVVRIANAASFEAAIQAKALRDAANAWTQGAWAEKLPPSDAIRPQIILGVANAAGDFLRARADEIERSARK